MASSLRISRRRLAPGVLGLHLNASNRSSSLAASLKQEHRPSLTSPYVGLIETTDQKRNTQQREDRQLWAEIMDGIRSTVAQSRAMEPVRRFYIPTTNQYLDLLVDFDMKSATVESLDSLTFVMSRFMQFGDNALHFSNDLRIANYLLHDGSLNHREIPPETNNLNQLMRTITIVYNCGFRTTFNALVLGRLWTSTDPTYWIVVLDEEKRLLALEADGVDPHEKNDDDEEVLTPLQFVKKDFFDLGVPVVILSSLAELQAFQELKEPKISPKPFQGAESWTSAYAVAPSASVAVEASHASLPVV